MLKKRSDAGGAGWESLDEIPTRPRRGIFMAIQGLEGRGKSSLAMTLARLGGVGYVDIDQSVDRARRPDNKKERERVHILPVRYSVGMGFSLEQLKQECGPRWKEMVGKIQTRIPNLAGVVFDTETELWEFKRLAEFGTTTPRGNRMDRLYGPVNASYRNMLRSIYRGAGKHLITIHQQKDEYIDKERGGELQSVRTGKYERKGFKEIGYLADIIVTCTKGKEFGGVIEVCKLSPNGPSMEGMELDEEQLDFATIVSLATDTEPGDWL